MAHIRDTEVSVGDNGAGVVVVVVVVVVLLILLLVLVAFVLVGELAIRCAQTPLRKPLETRGKDFSSGIITDMGNVPLDGIVTNVLCP